MEVMSLFSVIPAPSLRCGLKTKRFLVFSKRENSSHRNLRSKIVLHSEQEGTADHTSVIQELSRKRLPRGAQSLFFQMNSEGFLPDNSTLSALMLCYANNGFIVQAQTIWDEIINSSFMPSFQIISELIDAYARMRHFDKVTRIVHQLSLRDYNFLPEIYVLVISSFGKRGQLEMMESTLKDMVARGFPIDSASGNAFIIYYSIFGSLAEMEAAYRRLKDSRILIEKEAIKAMSLAYIKKRKLYSLGEFIRDVGLGRKNAGNLLWNVLLLSYAANFKMKSMQREFLKMVEGGFRPDLTTFNIRSLAFSKMSLFWDLHLSLEHMKHEGVGPDVVTFGCVVDAYLDKRLGRNMDFVLSKMNTDDSAIVSTDPFVFEALGKGEFHVGSEMLLEFKRKKKWTYKELIAIHLKKKYRSNQVFWNY